MTARRSRGNGGLYRDEQRECWIASATVGYTPAGKHIVEKAGSRTKTEAKDRLKEIIRGYDDGPAIAPTHYTVADAVKYWLQHGLGRRSATTWHHATYLIKGVEVTDPYAEFRWLDEDLGEIYCVSFVRGIPPFEALTRFGTVSGTIEEVTFDEVCGRAFAEAEASTRALPGYIGAVQIDGWSLIVEPLGWLAADPDVRARLSHGTEMVVITRHEYSTEEFIHEIDGETATYFHLIAPQHRWGSNPDRWLDAMREAGLDTDHDESGNSHPDFTFANAFALASKVTGVRFSKDVLNLQFLGAETHES
ncbi:DUF6461 domain-containing protein [Streptosporangium sp. NPDC087985]|uniref:DUF6461 domain-containing protein n=1 Tax=Streptosporangium sp. NPDC087985 TaxID=3366196 RepID=UPI0037F7267C